MREDELRKYAVCSICGKKLGESNREHNHLPLFWTVEIERHMLDIEALQRQTGLAMMLGGHGGLARIMGPDEEMTKSVSKHKVSVCEHCALEKRISLFELAQKACEEEEAEEAAESEGAGK